MALYSIDTLQEITHIPHRADFDRWCSRLTAAQIDTIFSKLRCMIDGDEIHTAGWMPGNDWSGTDWEPIYTDACQGDIHASGLCFGLFVWVAMQRHSDAWAFGRYEKDGIPIRSLTYFRIDIPGRPTA